MDAGSGPNGATIAEARAQLEADPLRAVDVFRWWDDFAVDVSGDYFVEEMVAPPRDHHVITLALGRSESVVQERCGMQFASPSIPGESLVIPAGFQTRWKGLLPAHVCMRIAPQRLRRVGEDLRAAGTVSTDVKNAFRLRDPVIRHLGELCAAELGRAPHPAQDLMMDAIAAALTVHVLRSCTNAAGVAPRRTAAIEPRAIRRVKELIDDAGDGTLSLSTLAAAAGVSRYHLCRLFKDQVGMTPMRYLERARIARAKTLIELDRMSLAEVAQAVGFADQSHFTRRFHTLEGCTPGEYARVKGRTQLRARSAPKKRGRDGS